MPPRKIDFPGDQLGAGCGMRCALTGRNHQRSPLLKLGERRSLAPLFAISEAGALSISSRHGCQGCQRPARLLSFPCLLGCLLSCLLGRLFARFLHRFLCGFFRRRLLFCGFQFSKGNGSFFYTAVASRRVVLPGGIVQGFINVTLKDNGAVRLAVRIGQDSGR
jgi:hypothetical protein